MHNRGDKRLTVFLRAIHLHRGSSSLFHVNPAALAAYRVRMEAIFGWLLSYTEIVYIISVHPPKGAIH